MRMYVYENVCIYPRQHRKSKSVNSNKVQNISVTIFHIFFFSKKNNNSSTIQKKESNNPTTTHRNSYFKLFDINFRYYLFCQIT